MAYGAIREPEVSLECQFHKEGPSAYAELPTECDETDE